jgi:hypothetical protein
MSRATHHRTESAQSTPGRAITTLCVMVAGASLVVGCAKSAPGTAQAQTASQATAPGHRYSACALISKEEMQTITGAKYTDATVVDDGHSSDSECQFAADGVIGIRSVQVSWVTDDDGDAAARAVSARIPINVARQGAGFMSKTAGVPLDANPTTRGGDITGLGDEAFFGMGILTVRKGDVSIRVVSPPEEMMAAVQDSTALPAAIDKDKAIARVVLAKL